MENGVLFVRKISQVIKVLIMNKSKITRKELSEARFQGNHVYGYFKAYCDLNDCCEHCNCLVRLLCKLKRKIEYLQVKIILYICKEG